MELGYTILRISQIILALNIAVMFRKVMIKKAQNIDNGAIHKNALSISDTQN